MLLYFSFLTFSPKASVSFKLNEDLQTVGIPVHDWEGEFLGEVCHAVVVGADLPRDKHFVVLNQRYFDVEFIFLVDINPLQRIDGS